VQAQRWAEIRLESNGNTVKPVLSLWPDGLDGLVTEVEGDWTELDHEFWASAALGRDALRGEGDPRKVDPAKADDFAEVLDKQLVRRSIGECLVELGRGATAEGPVALAIRLDADADPELWRVPWELLKADRTYWVAVPHRLLVRIVGAQGSAARIPEAQGRLRIQVVEGPRKLDGVDRLADSTVQELLSDGLRGVAVDMLERIVDPTIDQLRGLLEERSYPDPIDLLVFEGHGESTGLWLRDGEGFAEAASLVALLHGKVRAAVLLSCKAGTSSFGAGVAESFARAGIPTVAWQTILQQSAATRFVGALAGRLALGATLVEGVGEARGALEGEYLGVNDSCRLSIWSPDRESLHLRVPELPLVPMLASISGGEDAETVEVAVLNAAGLALVSAHQLLPEARPAVVAPDARWVAAMDGSTVYLAKVDRPVSTLRQWKPLTIEQVGEDAKLLAVGPYGPSGASLVVVDDGRTLLLRVGGPGEEPEVLDLGDECDAAAVVRGRPWLVRAGALEPAETEGWKPPEGWVLDIDVAGALGEEVLAIVVAPKPATADGTDAQRATVHVIARPLSRDREGDPSARKRKEVSRHGFTHRSPRVRLYRELSRQPISRMLISGLAKPIEWQMDKAR